MPEDLLPRIFAPGLYRCELLIYKLNDTEVQQTAMGVVKLY